jgi:hypothetical protein
MGVPARAAVEAPEGGRAPNMARSRARGISRRQRLLMSRGQWLDCAFRRFASLLGGGEPILVRGCGQNSDAQVPRDGAACASLRASAKQSSWLAREAGLLRRGACHRAGHFGPDPLAPRNDQLRHEN